MILQTIEELEAELNRGRFHPVYAVLGPEEYLCRQAIGLIKQKALAQDAVAFNYSEFSARETSAAKIIEAAQTYPMLSPRRLVLATDVDQAEPGDLEALLAYLEDPSTKSVLILDAENLDRRTVFYRRLKEKACVAEFARLKGPALERWAENFFRRRNIRISQASLKMVVDLAGEDLQSLSNEMEKLLIFAGKEKVIPETAVGDLISSSRQHSIFDLTAAIGSRDCAGALRQLESLIESGEDPLGIATMVARQFRQMLTVKDLAEQGKRANEIAAILQLPPFVVDKILAQVRGMDWQTARTMYLRLTEADYRFKSSPADKRMVLESLICSLQR